MRNKTKTQETQEFVASLPPEGFALGTKFLATGKDARAAELALQAVLDVPWDKRKSGAVSKAAQRLALTARLHSDACAEWGAYLERMRCAPVFRRVAA